MTFAAGVLLLFGRLGRGSTGNPEDVFGDREVVVVGEYRRRGGGQ
jgi:hypothetical protein